MSDLQQCYNRGCGQQFDPEKNTDGSCRHHPGAPYFHDVYKGWSCCNKKSVDFTEFLSIQGCTVSKHSNVKPIEPEKPAKNGNENSKDVVVEIRAPIKAAMDRPAIDTPMVEIVPTVAPALKQAIDERKASAPATIEKISCLAIGEVPLGTACKNSGCTCSYTGPSSNFSECQYHPGLPIFHEGMKYWSCCQKKTSDFTVFMAQKGCVSGQHKWFKENDDKKKVECRYDWHQTAANVIVSVYAKMYHYAQSTIKVNPIRLQMNLVFPERENATFNLDLELRGIIVVQDTKVNMYGSKIEITMTKAEPGSWSKLDFPSTKLLPPAKNENDVKSKSNKQNESSDDEFDLDDIENVNTGFRLSEIASTKNDLERAD